MTISESQLRQWCLEYDELHEMYPEHSYEGLNVLAFLLCRVKGLPYNDMAVEYAVTGADSKPREAHEKYHQSDQALLVGYLE